VDELIQSIKGLNLTTGQLVIIALFLLSWLECVAAWVFGIVESWSIRNLTGRLFGIGFVIRRDRFSAHPPYLTGDAKLELSLVQLKVVSPDRIIFAPLPRRELSGKILASLKGEVRWEAESAELTVRLPFGQMWFMFTWLSLCVIWAIMALMFSIPPANLIIPAVMLFMGTFMLRRTWKGSRRDSEILATEITKHLGADLWRVSGT
jgi:hypothetical protein